MLKLSVVAVVIAAVANAANLDVDWAVFKAKYNKKYTPELEVIRKNIWIENLKSVEEHNKLYSQGLSTYFLGENEYSDMTNTEFVSKMNGLKLPQPENVQKPMSSINVDTTSLPKSVDWRENGFVTVVKDQGYCGSCWAFSATGAIEGQHFNATGNLVSLSESNLIDCSSPYGNEGCNGGWPFQAFEYVIANRGIATEDSYPYVPQVKTCTYSSSCIGATISSYQRLQSGSESALQKATAEVETCTYSNSSIDATISSYQRLQSGSESALQKATAEVGPISVCIDASLDSFQQYKGGVYDDERCSKTSLNHAVLVVGYGIYESTPYWMVKNSWGTSFGIDGYIMMTRNQDNRCGIATAAVYPIV